MRFGREGGAADIWPWQQLLPGDPPGLPVSLGEGNTPLCCLDAPREITLLLKNESANPTWSYKDRANSVNITMARRLGFKRTAVIITGNHAVHTQHTQGPRDWKRQCER